VSNNRPETVSIGNIIEFKGRIIINEVGFFMGGQKDTGSYHLAPVQCLTLSKEVRFVRDVINLLYEFARLKVAQNNLEEAVELLVLVIEHPTSNQTRWLEGRIRDSAKGLLDETEAKLIPEVYKAALERGHELDLDGVVAKLVAPNL